MKKVLSLLCVGALGFGLVGCSCKDKELPRASDGEVYDPNSGSFAQDKNININTIDDYLNLDNVAYRDMRLLIDSDGYNDLPGGDAILSGTIEGFKISPLPYIASLENALPVTPVSLKYKPLFDVTWSEGGAEILEINSNYEESIHILNEIFPQDKLIFLMCGGGGYAYMTKQILVELGYDSSKIYNLGGFWAYTGEHKVDLVSYYDKNNNGKYEGEFYSFYKADYMAIDKVLEKLNEEN